MKILILTIGAAVVALASTAAAQSAIYGFDGDSPNDRFGTSVSGAGDVNADGLADVVIGAFRDDNNGNDSGLARVFSGTDGSVLYTFEGNAAEDWFGLSVSGAGDVNADGYADLIVGAPNNTNTPVGPGKAQVFSGLDGSVLYTFGGDSLGDVFGHSVADVGDVNGDGFPDLVVGAMGDDNNGPSSGSARVFSGSDGSSLYTFDGDSPGDEFGWVVGGAGDVNGDGFADLIVGAHKADNNGLDSGSARVFSGVDGSVLYTFDGDSPGDRLGVSVSGAGDVNGDGYDDVIVGIHLDDDNGSNSGSARVFSGVDGSTLYTFYGDGPNDWFGISVSRAGDVNVDGFADLIVGAHQDDNNGPASGSARVFSGVDGSILYTLDGDSAGDRFGSSVGAAGDVDGDGHTDIVVGAPTDDNNGADSGSAQIFSGCDACLGTNYCAANPNSSGLPAIMDAIGSKVIANNYLILRTVHVAPNQFGYYLMSASQDFVPLFAGSQGNLCLGAPIVRFNIPPTGQVVFSGAAGVMDFSPDLTNLPQGVVFQSGETWNFQLWFRDVVGPVFTSNTSDGLEITWQ